MEKTMDLEQKTLISELIQGRELANRLMDQLQLSSSQENRDLLVAKILSSYEKALSLLNQGANFVGETKPITTGLSESPRSFGSPTSEICDHDSNHKNVSKKRKTLARWSEKVKVCSETGLEGPLNDGYSWRKYGQKEIHGANHPRSYYRCTHRNVQGCLATKQVQRLNEDPSVFEVTYRGRHTCSQSSQLAMASASLNRQGLKGKKNNLQQHENDKQTQSQEMFFNFGAGLKVKTEGSEDTRKDDIFPLFSFPCTPTECENVENHIFSESMIENNFMVSFSPPFVSPAASESNYFSVSPCHVSNFGHNVQTFESDHAEILSAPTSVTNSPIGDRDLPFDEEYFELDFSFDNLDQLFS